MRRGILTLSASILLVVALAGCSSAGSAAAENDVTITACTPSRTGTHPTVAGRIVNHSSKASLYTIHVKFADATGNGAGDGLAAVAKVEAGAQATWHATGTVDVKGPVACT